ncbi:sensor histidine kinase [Nocardia transvalensis]|uniref:sensor histidine kinase n=1 Tax=Nocardia transvalensis TaxID=37333 RepID=UPI00189632A8|nr:histidine kinase [Nocardia transvalensis]MBF6332527.1 hypothetical protein [Nocardia transvalensis]
MPTLLRRAPWTDRILGIVALLFACLAWLLAIAESDGQRLSYTSFAVLSTGVALLVFVRRIWVVPAFLGTYALFAGMALTTALSSVYLSIQPILLFAPISLMAVTEYARSWWWGPIAFIVGIVGSFGSPATRAESFSWSIKYHILVLAAAYLWASRRRAVRKAHERALAAARANERALIAAELHDVLGHTLAAVRAQAGAGLVVAERRGESTADVLRTVAEISKEALGDIRHLVGLLRDGHEPATSADSFTDLRDTVRRARAAGITVVDNLPSDDTLTGWQRHWPAPTRLAVLRVVREGVTNVIKHGGPQSHMTVTVREEGGLCRIVVENEGTVPHHFDRGSGLTGLRERMSSVGGTLDVVATDKGVRLQAQLPIPAQSYRTSPAA